MKKSLRKSGVSSLLDQAYISAINELNLNKSLCKKFTIKVANTLDEREAVFKLGYHVYLEKKYIRPNNDEMYICNYDFDKETVILILQDKSKNIIASVTLVFNENTILPAQNIYKKEYKLIRKKYIRVTEFCRFVVDPSYRNSQNILTTLFNYAVVYMNNIKKYDAVVIEVTPRHKNYYKVLFDFKEIGPEKCCPQVANTVGVLLYISTKCYNKIRLKLNTDCVKKKYIRMLYSKFISIEKNKLIENYLLSQITPMSFYEKNYFSLKSKRTATWAISRNSKRELYERN